MLRIIVGRLCRHSCWFVFFFKYTATTEIYTYCHTLSLPDALPIWPRHHGLGPRAQWRHAGAGHRPGHGPAFSHGRPGLRGRFASTTGRECSRSEEHTSELQSLMRISYAVFCLKKKKTNQMKTLNHKYNNIIKITR